jgi:hypothetical protein
MSASVAGRAQGSKAGTLAALLLLPLALGFAGPSSADPPEECDTPGPDAAGYTCERAAFAWEDTAGGTTLALGDDDTEIVDLPFPFLWLGGWKDRVYIGSNGLVCFSNYDPTPWCSTSIYMEPCYPLDPECYVNGGYVSQPRPPHDNQPNDFFACFWEDLDPSAGGEVVYKALGDAPNRRFVIEYRDVPHYDTGTNVVGTNTFQVQLMEPGEARCMWQDVADDEDQAPTAVAAERPDGTGLRHTFTEFAAEEEGMRIACALNGAPANPTAWSGPGRGEVLVDWQPAKGGCRPLSYRLYAGDGSGPMALLADNLATLQYVDAGLPDGASRTYQVAAVNPGGEGSLSFAASARAPVAPDAPRSLAAQAGPTLGDITLTWDHPASAGGASVQEYRVTRGEASGEGSLLATLATPQVPTESFLDTPRLLGGEVFALPMDGDDLGRPGPGQARDVSGQGHHAQLWANAWKGTGRFGAGVSPGDPTNASYVDMGHDMARMNVATPTMMFWFNATIASDFTLLFNDGLLNGPRYQRRMFVALNQTLLRARADVDDNTTAEVNFTITLDAWHHVALTYDHTDFRVYFDGALRGQVRAPGNLSVSNGNFYFDSPGGLDEVRYYDRPLSLAEIQSIRMMPYLGRSTVSQSFLDAGVPEGATRYYRVSAANAVGEGPRSPEASATVPMPTAPGAPRALRASAGPGDGEVTLAWDAPASDGGRAVTGHRVYRGTTSGALSFLADAGAALGYVDTGLGNGATRYYHVRAVNSIGEGNAGAEASATTFDVPGPARGTAAAAGPGAGQIKLTWQAPSSDGGRAVTGYRVYRGTTSGALSFLDDAGTALSFTDGGLGNGATRYYEVRALNAVGEGPPGAEVSARTAVPPGAPQAPSVARAGRGTLTLSWQAPADSGGLAVTGYRVYAGDAPGGAASLQALGDVRSFTESGLPSGTTRYYRVSAVNGVGEGALSAEVSGKTAAPPGPPRALAATKALTVYVGGPGTVALGIRLDWQPPADDGGAPITAYRVYAGTTPDPQQVTSLGNVTTHNARGDPLRANYYKVSAVNSEGEGPSTVVVCQTTYPWLPPLNPPFGRCA